MPTRPSAGTPPRSKKAPTRNLPPVTTVTNEEPTRTDVEAVDDRAADGVLGESPDDDGAKDNVEITRSKLERRQIPSFSETREARIAERAYWRAERRGFEPGHELDDWLSAEQDVDSAPSK